MNKRLQNLFLPIQSGYKDNKENKVIIIMRECKSFCKTYHMFADTAAGPDVESEIGARYAHHWVSTSPSHH